jgi:diguanylate cyclase (GGDEF)-like protein/PAS domain S-box-containing protein
LSRVLAPQELDELGTACRELYALDRTETVSLAVVDFACQVAAQLAVRAGTTTASLTRLNRCVVEVQRSLSKELLSERNDAYYELRRALREEHEISLDLLRSHGADPRSLRWLGGAHAAAGILAFWVKHGPGAALCTELEVAGTFEPHGSSFPTTGTKYQVEDFPPGEFLEAAGSDNVVLLFPVTSGERDWGVLSVAVPLDSGFMGQDTHFQWETLLSEALDYQQVLQSLRERSTQLHERSEQLALSYQREREMARAVRQSEERYALAARAVNDGMWDWDLEKGTVYYSARWGEMLGYLEGVIGNSPEEWLGRVHADDRAGLIADLTALKQGERTSVLHEHRVKTTSGNYIWALCRGLAVPGEPMRPTRMVGSLTDVTDRRLLEERLRQQALYDALTGLPNRVLFLDRLAQTIANFKRAPGNAYAVLWLDLDGFKMLNDNLGHQMGDKLLVEVASRLRSQLRDSDTAARFGGDEFAVLLRDVPDMGTIEAVVRRLLERLGALYDLEGNGIAVTASIGVTTGANGYERSEDALRDADIAMYRAKSKGRGTYAIFEPSMRATEPAPSKPNGRAANDRSGAPRGTPATPPAHERRSPAPPSRSRAKTRN